MLKSPLREHEIPMQKKSSSTSTIEPIAIIGMSCRFPKAANIDAFLALLKNGESSLVDVPLERWDNNKYYSSDMNALGRICFKQLGLLDDIKLFDAEFFNVSPREAKLMSPQLRILMETSYHALEHANLSSDSLKNTNTGVFIGCEGNDYPEVLINQGLTLEDLGIYVDTGNAKSALAGRLAYFFDFHGPIQLIDTSCSSSMTAVHNACLSLQAGDCTMALAGGVNLLLSPVSSVSLSQAKMLSPDSRCKTFSEGADGYVRSEGCGIIVLKRLSTAINNKDNILAVIKGSGVNSDGKSTGFTVPNGSAQEALIRGVLANANLLPSDIDYIETHGTGTPVGDPIEVNALTNIFSEHHSNDKPLYISSVKTNIGHCESASGMAGIIKAILSLQTRTIFKHLNFKKLNPAIQLKNTVIPLENIIWNKEQELRYAGVNSFGFTGANAHIILKEAERGKKAARILPDESLLILSAKNQKALELLLASYQIYLSSTHDPFPDICYTAATSRNHFLFRVAIKASNAIQAAAIISNNDYTIYQIKEEKNTAQPTLVLDLLQTAYQEGFRIDWSDFYNSLKMPFEKVTLPRYEFTRTEYWFESIQKPGSDSPNYLKSIRRETVVDNQVMHPLLGQMVSMPANEYLFHHSLNIDHLIYLKQCRVFEKVIFSASACIEAGLSAAKSMLNNQAFSIEKFNVQRQLFLQQDQAIQLQAKFMHDGYKISIFAKQDKHWHSFCDMEVQAIPSSSPRSVTLKDLTTCFADSLERLQIYDNLRKRAICCDDEFQVIQEAHVKSDSVLARVVLPKVNHGHGYYYHPALLDGAMQSVLLLTDDTATYLPYAFKRLTVFQAAPRNIWVHVTTHYLNELCVDIKIYDSTGLLIADLERLQLKRVTRRDFISYDRALHHLYHTTWRALDPALIVPRDYPELFVISNDPLKVKKRLGNLNYQLIQDLSNLTNIENKNILFFYEQGQFMDLFHHCQVLCKSPPASFILITELAYAIKKNDQVNPYHTMASSFWKSFRNELDFKKNYTIDVDSNSTLIATLASVLSVNNVESQFAVRDTIYVSRLEKKELPIETKKATAFDSNASYLIVGGTGGLAKPLIEYLIQKNVTHITTISRTECAKDTLSLISHAAEKHVTIEHHAVDASNDKQMQQIVETIEKSPHPLKGVFHLAGISQNGLIVNLNDDNIHNVLNAKMEVALLLHQLTKNIPLDFFVMFSSIASLLGGRGQSNYAAANGFLDGLAHLRKQQGKPALVINWGPFHTVGMAANITESLQQQGYIPLNKESIDILDILLENQLTQISPCPMDWDLYFKYAPMQAWLSNLVKLAPPQDLRFLNSLRQRTKEDRVTVLSQVLCEITADVLAMDGLETITENDDLFSMGLDSLMSLEIRHQIYDKLQSEALSIPIEYFINEPRINKIAQYIADELQLVFEDAPHERSLENTPVKEVALCDFQYLLWVIYKFGYSYNVGMQVQLHGPLNKDYASQALSFIVQNNDAFWIRFSKDTLLQTLDKEGLFHLIYKDMSLDTKENNLQKEFYANLKYVVPLEKPPLIRVYLYKINDDLHEWHVVIPHIIADISSCEIVLRQFMENYGALVLGKALIKTPEKRSFLNYVQQNNYHYEKNLKNKIAFWKSYNKGFKKLSFNLADHVPDAAVYQTKHLFDYALSPQLIEPFIHWHKEKNINLSTGLVAACQTAFYNISKQKNIPILLIHSGREGSQYKSVVGLFAEYKKVNVSFNEEDTFYDRLRSIEEQLLKTAPYQKCSLLIKNIGLERSLLSIGRLVSLTFNKFFISKKFKKNKINTRLNHFYLELLTQINVNKIINFMKYKCNQLFNLNIPLQQPHGLDVLICITPSFFITEIQNTHFANLHYTFASQYAALDRPIGNKGLWVYFTKNQHGEYLLSINGPITKACKDQIALEFNKVLSAISSPELSPV